MIKIKQGADVRGLHPAIWKMVYDIEPLFYSEDKTLVITSGLEGEHSHGSLHYVGCAVDIRTRHLEDAREMFDRIKAVIHTAFDVVYHKTHIHIEYQPKNQAERI